MKKIYLEDLTYLIHAYQKVVILPKDCVESDYVYKSWKDCRTGKREITDIYPLTFKGNGSYDIPDVLVIHVKK